MGRKPDSTDFTAMETQLGKPTRHDSATERAAMITCALSSLDQPEPHKDLEFLLNMLGFTS